jgi:hypothetical protein
MLVYGFNTLLCNFLMGEMNRRLGQRSNQSLGATRQTNVYPKLIALKNAMYDKNGYEKILIYDEIVAPFGR